MKALFKAFIKRFQAPQQSVEIIRPVNFYFNKTRNARGRKDLKSNLVDYRVP